MKRHPALDLIRQRISVNRFDPTFEVDDATIRDLISYASEAPSAYNLQNWRFIAVKSTVRKRALMAHAYDQEKVVDAAVTFIVCGLLEPQRGVRAAMLPFRDDGHIDDDFLDEWADEATATYRDNPAMQRDEAIRSASLAAMNLMIAAQAMGLASGPMIGFDPSAVSTDFDLADTEFPVMLIAVGRIGPNNWPRKRRRPVDHVLTIV
ncbi:nitroreductase family protein [Ideonella sp.]|uniref:nitroreductase family protein n=1 Tax=Ideonella sp. TaxID=1929293 RepID=UPI002B481C43|nr:nitroreductase family protein [Ideonella sp.]HJV71694.1 nitroreductase family protein [Ideonella sp.]